MNRWVGEHPLWAATLGVVVSLPGTMAFILVASFGVYRLVGPALPWDTWLLAAVVLMSVSQVLWISHITRVRRRAGLRPTSVLLSLLAVPVAGAAMFCAAPVVAELLTVRRPEATVGLMISLWVYTMVLGACSLISVPVGWAIGHAMEKAYGDGRARP